MIKNFLNADEEPPGIKVIIEDKIINLPVNEMPVRENENIKTENLTRDVFEIPGTAKFFTPVSGTTSNEEKIAPLIDEAETPQSIDATDDLLELETQEKPLFETPNAETLAENLDAQNFSDQSAPGRRAELIETSAIAGTPISRTEKPMFQTDFKSETPDETIRKSGMAYSAAIVLVASIAFMMVLGWFADLLLGIKPFGIVGGIILGAILGFIQFFRITSSIFK